MIFWSCWLLWHFTNMMKILSMNLGQSSPLQQDILPAWLKKSPATKLLRIVPLNTDPFSVRLHQIWITICFPVLHTHFEQNQSSLKCSKRNFKTKQRGTLDTNHLVWNISNLYSSYKRNVWFKNQNSSDELHLKIHILRFSIQNSL